MRAAKKIPTFNLTQMIKQKTWKNDELRQKLQREHGASIYLIEKIRLIVESLEQILLKFQKLSTEFKNQIKE